MEWDTPTSFPQPLPMTWANALKGVRKSGSGNACSLAPQLFDGAAHAEAQEAAEGADFTSLSICVGGEVRGHGDKML